MVKKIKRINPLQFGKVSAVLYGFLSIIFVPLMIIPAIITKQPGPGIIVILVMPVIYTAVGFIMAVIGAAVYNLCATWVGGIEVELED